MFATSSDARTKSFYVRIFSVSLRFIRCSDWISFWQMRPLPRIHNISLVDGSCLMGFRFRFDRSQFNRYFNFVFYFFHSLFFYLLFTFFSCVLCVFFSLTFVPLFFFGRLTSSKCKHWSLYCRKKHCVFTKRTHTPEKTITIFSSLHLFLIKFHIHTHTNGENIERSSTRFTATAKRHRVNQSKKFISLLNHRLNL